MAGLGRFSISYSSASGFGGGFGVLDAIKGKFGLRDPAGVSLAKARDPDNPYVAPRSILSAVANAAAQQAQAALSRQSIRPDQTQIPVSVPQTFAATGPGKLEPLVVQKGTQTMSLDLGNLLGNLGGQYIQARWGQPQPPTILPGAPYGNQPIVAQGPRAGVAARPVDNLFELGQEGYDYFFGNGTAPKNMTVDPVTGRLCKKQRRRRRRLATKADIKDLAALKSVMTPADLKTWIATHPS